MASQVASLYGVLSLKDDFSGGLDAAEKNAKGFGARISDLGDAMTGLGGTMLAVSGPFVAGMGLATQQALAFNKSMTNTQAVLGKTDAEMADVNAQILAMGAASTSGPQAAADAFYDIVGGIADASTHLDILQTSLDVATAGSADLGGVVDALVKSVNIFGLSAADAGRAGDVLVRAVGVGVGTMDEFAAALPPVSGLANELGFSFDETAGFLAYMSTQASSVAEGGTMLRGVFSKLINPTDDLKTAIQAMGYESGAAMVEQEGLLGSLELIKNFGGGSFAGLITDQEALLGAIALTKDGTAGFLENYTTGIVGATEAAKAIQLDDPAAQVALLQSSVSGLAITVGNALLPALNNIMRDIAPVIEKVTAWAAANPELVAQIGMAAVAVFGFGIALVAVGTVISAVSTILGGLKAIVMGVPLLLTLVSGAGGVATTVLTAMGAATVWVTTGLAGMGMGALAAVAPILAVIVPIMAVIAAMVALAAAAKTAFDFIGKVTQGANDAQTAIAKANAAGAGITDQMVFDQAFGATAEQFGGGFGGDLAARLLAGPIANAATAGGTLTVPGRATGGSVTGGSPYMVGERGPELFVPGQSGQIVPNHAMGGGVQIGSITIQANSAREGREAGDAFVTRVNDLMRTAG